MKWTLVEEQQDLTGRYVGYNAFDDDGKGLGYVTYDQKNKLVARMVPDTLYFRPDFDTSLTKLVSLINDHFEHKVESVTIYTGHGEIVEVMESGSFHSTDKLNARVKIADAEIVGNVYPAVDVEKNKAYNEEFEADNDWNNLETQVTFDWAKPGARAIVDYFDNTYVVRPGSDSEFASNKVNAEVEQREKWVRRATGVNGSI